MNGIVMPSPDDFHVHVRDDEMMRLVLPETTRTFGRALMMPNLPKPITTAERMIAYRDRILAVAPSSFEPLMTIYLTEETTPEMIIEAGRAGAVASKFYPKDGTNNSSHGVSPTRLLEREDWFEALGQAGMALCIHGEVTDVDLRERERTFMELFVNSNVANRFPKTRFVLEHLSSANGVETVDRYRNVGGTITLHHLKLTYDDAMSNPHHFCMPVPKTEDDVRALSRAVLSGENRRLFFGSDSAPHPLDRKEGTDDPKPGVYSAPGLMEKLAEWFDDADRLSRLKEFAAGDGAAFYGLPEPKGQIELVRETSIVPIPIRHPGALTPFYGGRPVSWTVRHDR